VGCMGRQSGQVSVAETRYASCSGKPLPAIILISTWLSAAADSAECREKWTCEDARIRWLSVCLAVDTAAAAADSSSNSVSGNELSVDRLFTRVALINMSEIMVILLITLVINRS